MGAGLPSTANLQFKSFDQLVADLSNRWGGATGTTPNLKSGSVAKALFETFATQFVYFEFLLQAIQAMARLSTSVGSDCDSFVGDFGMPRLPATLASGSVTLGLLSPSIGVTPVAVGTVVQSQGGVFQYQLVADLTQPAYNASLQAYVFQPGQTSITATAQAVLPGSSQNVQASILTQLAQAGSGVDTVTNPSPIQNGKDQETDAQLKARFVLFIAAFSEATEAAILFAIASTQQGLDVALLDNTNTTGNPEPGFFTAVVEDGSGTLPLALQTALYNAIDVVRAFTIEFAVIGPTLISPTVALPIHVAAGANVGLVTQAVATAILDYVNSLTIGQSLNLSRLILVAEDADPNVANVNSEGVLINGLDSDLVVNQVSLIRLTSGNLTVSTF